MIIGYGGRRVAAARIGTGTIRITGTTTTVFEWWSHKGVEINMNNDELAAKEAEIARLQAELARLRAAEAGNRRQTEIEGDAQVVITGDNNSVNAFIHHLLFTIR